MGQKKVNFCLVDEGYFLDISPGISFSQSNRVWELGRTSKDLQINCSFLMILLGSAMLRHLPGITEHWLWSQAEDSGLQAVWPQCTDL